MKSTRPGNFNPHSRVGNDEFKDRTVALLRNFNPRSRVGNDEDRDATAEEAERISIHVPAWGTTCLQLYFQLYHLISIHVPAWGTTQILRYNTQHLLFQSTFPRGERQITH